MWAIKAPKTEKPLGSWMSHFTRRREQYEAWQEKGILREQDPKVLVVELPILMCIPIEARHLKLQGTFKTPVYVTQDRRNAMGVGLVFTADLASNRHPSHWVLQGVALCLNIDE